MGRPRKYATNADKQAAYRARTATIEPSPLLGPDQLLLLREGAVTAMRLWDSKGTASSIADMHRNKEIREVMRYFFKANGLL